MDKTVFSQSKNDLINFIKAILEKKELSTENRSSCNILSALLAEYSYENRLEKKGLLTHTIIDSLELDYSIGEKFIEFDNRIM